jgi:hypothetical protein
MMHPQNNRRTPFGVVLVAFCAFMSAVILLLMFGTGVVPMAKLLVSGAGLGREFIRFEYFSVPLGLTCELILAGLAIVAGLDLLKLKERGRKLALTSMLLLLPLSVLLGLAVHAEPHLQDAADQCFATSALCVAIVIYLVVPPVRSYFHQT